ncbi:MAG TPA: 50S ribosomal protein L11 methyltransferase [Clostridiaceae bacterium]|nr:50S ribosomal protein L11 methyltransferase [Clostridiaceae bacterium]
MKWIEITVTTTEEAWDAVSEMLMSIGAGGVAVDDPNEIKREILKSNSLDYADDKFLESLGQDVVIKAYFSDELNPEELKQLVKEKLNYISGFLNVGKGTVETTRINDQDWSENWKKYYKPFHITKRVVIKPTWENYQKVNDEIVIEIDPGMAFGTGTHETTSMCAKFLEKYMKEGDTVIDVGSGTGILSIIAARLGAKKVVALDIDNVAFRVSRENCILNHVNDVVEVHEGVLKDIIVEKSDIVVANIIADVIIDLSNSMENYIKNNGLFITSGIIKERKDQVIKTYTQKGFICEEMAEDGEWVAIVFRCQGSL